MVTRFMRSSVCSELRKSRVAVACGSRVQRSCPDVDLAQQTCNAEILKDKEDDFDRCSIELNVLMLMKRKLCLLLNMMNKPLLQRNLLLNVRLAIGYAPDRSVSVVSPYLANILEKIPLNKVILPC